MSASPADIVGISDKEREEMSKVVLTWGLHKDKKAYLYMPRDMNEPTTVAIAVWLQATVNQLKDTLSEEARNRVHRQFLPRHSGFDDS